MVSRTPLERAFRDYMRWKMLVITRSRGEVATLNNGLNESEFLNDNQLNAFFKALIKQCLLPNIEGPNTYNHEERFEDMNTIKNIQNIAYEIQTETDIRRKLSDIEHLEELLKELYKHSDAIVLSKSDQTRALNAYKTKNAPPVEAPANAPQVEAPSINSKSTNSKEKSSIFSKISEGFGRGAKKVRNTLSIQAGGSISRKTKKSKKRRGTKKRK